LERATPTQGERVLAEAAEAYRVALGDRLLAAYALGSLAHGGFSELVSDVDLGLIVSDPLRAGDDETIEAIAETEKRKRSPLHERLSVFWGTPTTLRGEQKGGRFPALDRLDLIENAEKLNAAVGPTALFIPTRGVSLIATEGQPFYHPEADQALLDALRENIDPSRVEVYELDVDINAPRVRAGDGRAAPRPLRGLEGADVGREAPTA
jgi:hypothetical protein